MASGTRGWAAAEPIDDAPGEHARLIDVRVQRDRDVEVADPRRMTGRVVAILLAAVAGLALSLVALGDDLSSGNGISLPRVEVPSVKGLDLPATHRRLEALGFVVDVKFQPNEVVPKGQVFNQEPPQRARSEQGAVISVIASDGPVGVTAPNVVGQQVADATANLAAEGLAIAVTNVHDEQVRVGEVIRTVPGPGQRVTDATVRAQVSDGPAPRIVPDVVGKPIEVALAAIGHDGLNIGAIDRTTRADLAPGTVFGVDPPAGTGLPRNTPVSLKVAGPAPTVIVPYLVALRESSAAAVLKSAGLPMTVINSPVLAGDPNDGKVIAQGFPPQAEVKAGTTIEVTVAVAPPPDPSASTTAAPGG